MPSYRGPALDRIRELIHGIPVMFPGNARASRVRLGSGPGAVPDVLPGRVGYLHGRKDDFPCMTHESAASQGETQGAEAFTHRIAHLRQPAGCTSVALSCNGAASSTGTRMTRQ